MLSDGRNPGSGSYIHVMVYVIIKRASSTQKENKMHKNARFYEHSYIVNSNVM